MNKIEEIKKELEKSLGYNFNNWGKGDLQMLKEIIEANDKVNIMKEIFKDILGYEGLYQVSNLGRVYSLPKEWVTGLGGVRSHNGKILKLSIDTKGYLKVNLWNEGKQKTKRVHQLVAITFLNHELDGHKIVVDHMNNNSLDNRVENLQLITNRENTSKDKKRGSSQYVGVYWHKTYNKWISSIRINNIKVSLGYFIDEYDAHLAYQSKLKEILTNQISKPK